MTVDHVSCAFAPGTLTAIVGPNGAGKTACFNLITGQLAASEGQVLLDGHDITTFPAPLRTRRGLGRAFQLTQRFPNLTVRKNVRLAELRRLAIVNSYRALIDITTAGGYGVFYGPNVDAGGTAGSGEGRVAGTEYIAYSDDGSGTRNVTLLVQVPDSFDPLQPCIITATSSGSRGVYGAITTGEWGLKRGCAAAYTDKGTGGAPHDLANNTVPLIDGTRSSATAAGAAAQFNAGLSAADLAGFNAASPNRFAFKHAHSGRNPQKDWGQFTLQAVEFAF